MNLGDSMFENKKIFIFGMARSGYEVAKLLLKRNCDILIVDSKEQKKEHVDEIISLGGKVIITEHPEDFLDDTFFYVVKNPGIKKNHICLEKARKLSIPIINEMELSYYLLPKATIIGVTGSNGKTTTTTLIYHILKRTSKTVHLGGNIGYPLSSLVDFVKPDDIILLEISDHQLCDMYRFKTNISVFTNVSPTHLDFHESYDVYKEMKMRIFNHHTKEDIAILNYDNEVVELTKNIKSKKYYFSKSEGKDIFYTNEKIICPSYLEINLSSLKVKGSHNYENIMAAILVSKCLKVDPEIVKEELEKFNGVEHRIEYVCEKNGITFYNDSKSTNNVSTITALKSFDKPVHLLLGGLDRGQSYEELYPFMNYVKEVICFGETKQKIKEFCNNHSIPCMVVDHLKEATLLSYKNAQKEDIVLLSPAHASWDQYQCFEDRGNEFKEVVSKI